MSAKFVQVCHQIGDSRFNQFRKYNLTLQLVKSNALMGNTLWVDKLTMDMERQLSNINKSNAFDPDRKSNAI